MMRKAISVGLYALLLLQVGVASALAAEPSGVVNPGVRVGEWLVTNVTALFPPVLAVVALYYLMRRAFTQFLSFAVFAAVVSLFVYAPDAFKDAAVGFTKWVIGR